MTLKILFLDTEEGSLYDWDYKLNHPTDHAILDLVDDHGQKLDVQEVFSFTEIREALDAIADLVEACNAD